jgi:hypothetical protein
MRLKAFSRHCQSKFYTGCSRAGAAAVPLFSLTNCQRARPDSTPKSPIRVCLDSALPGRSGPKGRTLTHNVRGGLDAKIAPQGVDDIRSLHGRAQRRSALFQSQGLSGPRAPRPHCGLFALLAIGAAGFFQVVSNRTEGCLRHAPSPTPPTRPPTVGDPIGLL